MNKDKIIPPFKIERKEKPTITQLMNWIGWQEFQLEKARDLRKTYKKELKELYGIDWNELRKKIK